MAWIVAMVVKTMTAIVRVLINDVARRGRKTHTHLSTEMIMVRQPEQSRQPLTNPRTLLRTDHRHHIRMSGIKIPTRQSEVPREIKMTNIPSTRDRQNRHRFIRSFRPARKTKDRWRWLQRQVFVHKLVATCTSHQHYWSMVRIFSSCRKIKQICSQMWSTLGEVWRDVIWRLYFGVWRSVQQTLFSVHVWFEQLSDQSS